MKSKRLYLLLIILIGIVLIRLLYLMFVKKDYYADLFKEKTSHFVYINEYPRGRILDRKGNILVDNIGSKVIVYKKENKTIEEEISIAKQLAKIIDLNEIISEKILKSYYIILNNEYCNSLITNEEYEKYNTHKLSYEDIYNLKLSRLNINEFNFDSLDKKAALIYNKMQKGYAYEIKYIKTNNVTEEEIINIIKENIDGINITMTWERYYPYGSLIRNILGNVSSIKTGVPSKLLKYYNNTNYSLEDRVGISYLELMYDKYLQPTKSIYKLKGDNSLELVKKGNPGNDLVLSVDISLIKDINDILESEMIKAKKEKNTSYYNQTYIIVSNPLNGEIIVPLSLKYVNENFIDNSEQIILSSFTLGSVVKGASSTVNYLYDLIPYDQKINDACIKLYLVPEKCSHIRLGILNDTKALAYSSNYYQYLTAIYLTGNEYTYNMNLEVTRKEFDIYRDVFASYGLGVKTDIDLPNEKGGIIGNNIAADLLLNLSIGQYDTYTPISLTQYINTIASGSRIAPRLLNKVIDYKGNTVYLNDTKILNNTLINEDKLDRVRLGFESVFKYGTAKRYANKNIKAAGKTGTSETLIDTNNDKIVDTESVTTSVALYFPYDNPLYSLSIISPNISSGKDSETHVSDINKRLTNRITELLLEKD